MFKLLFGEKINDKAQKMDNAGQQGNFTKFESYDC